MIVANSIKKNFEEVEVLKGVDLRISKGELVAIVGPSGAGKTTLMQIVGSLMKSDSGNIIIDGVDINKLSPNKLAEFRNQKIGFVFQFHHLLPEFDAIENVMLPSLIAGESRSVAKSKAMELLVRVGLENRMTHKPSQLSGGEQQRVAVARALINNPAVLLADEPTGNLDTHNRDELFKLLLDLRDNYNLTIVVVTHESQLAESADRVITLIDGLECK